MEDFEDVIKGVEDIKEPRRKKTTDLNFMEYLKVSELGRLIGLGEIDISEYMIQMLPIIAVDEIDITLLYEKNAVDVLEWIVTEPSEPHGSAE